jgi:hypothetical protein
MDIAGKPRSASDLIPQPDTVQCASELAGDEVNARYRFTNNHKFTMRPAQFH